MDHMKKHTVQAWALVGTTVIVLGVLLWFYFRTPFPGGHPGPPPEGMPAFGLPPEPPSGPRPGPPPFRHEWAYVLLGLFVFLVNLTVVAIRRVRKDMKAEPLQVSDVPAVGEPETIVFKTDYKKVTVILDDIRYIESMSEYVKVHLDSQENPLVVLYSLKRLAEELPAKRFMRIHRSYIVALNRIRESNATSVTLEGGVTLPIGASFRTAFREYFRS